MSNQVYRITEYTFSENESLLFDTNIWLYIYGPQGNRYPRYKDIYTSAFRRIRGAKCRILLDVMVLSEFINAYSRFFYNELPQATKPDDFKTFRDSAEFLPVAEEIAKFALRIVDKAELTESGFESANLRAIVREYGAGGSDFNDQMLAQLCEAKGLKLVTHDADFKGDNVTILTANPKLLT